MKIHEITGIADAEIVQGVYEDVQVGGGYTSDLLSDVMAHAKTGDVLITIQAHKNTVAVAVLVGAPAIIICNGRLVPEDMIQAARDEGIAVLRSDLCQFEVSGRLWKSLRP